MVELTATQMFLVNKIKTNIRYLPIYLETSQMDMAFTHILPQYASLITTLKAKKFNKYVEAH